MDSNLVMRNENPFLKENFEIVALWEQIDTGEKLLNLLNERFKPETKFKIYDVTNSNYCKIFEIMSWRGNYKNYALHIAETENEFSHTVSEIINILKRINGYTDSGYKGGRYEFSNEDILVFEYDWSEYKGYIPIMLLYNNENEELILLIVRKSEKSWLDSGIYGSEVCY